jgi:putative ABC transport system permease protein
VTGRAVLTAASRGAARHLVQTTVIFGVVAAAAAAGTLGLTLATSANEGFAATLAADHGADLAVTIDAAKVTAAELASTARLPGVTQAAGPYDETYITYINSKSPPPSAPSLSSAGIPRGQVNPASSFPGVGLSVAGRASTGGPLDHIILQQGQWPTRPGQIVLSDDRPATVEIGDTITVTSAPGKPTLKVVGFAVSITGDQRDWVVPSQVAALRPGGQPELDQMLYTFTSAATAQQVNADLAELERALPPGAVINWVSWLSAQSTSGAVSGLNTPFTVAYGIIGLVLAVLITASMVSAAVAAGYRRIGLLKSVGFTPAQVTAAYLAQTGMPTLAGAIAGTALGNWWVDPMLNGGGPDNTVAVPLWVNLVVPVGLLALTGLAALVPAVRASRRPAARAIAAAQAPRAGRGYAVYRLAGKLALPRPVSIGLAAPFTRPARSAVTLAVVAAGLTAVVLATGLDSSISTIDTATTQPEQTVQVWYGPPRDSQALTTSRQQTITSALRATPGTLGYLAEASGTASVAGTASLTVTAYSGGDAAAFGWDITSGTWYTGPGQVVVNTARAGTAGLTDGAIIQMTIGGKTVTARITGQVYAPGPPGIQGALLTSQQTLADTGIHLPVTRDEVLIGGIKQSTKAPTAPYEAALQRTLGPRYTVTSVSLGVSHGPTDTTLTHGVDRWALVDTSLARLLTIMIAVLAGLGVLNTVLMLTRERVRDLGVFKAVGMTPRQAITLVTCWAIAPAIAAAAIALPAGMALHSTVIQAIAADQAPATAGASLLAPASVINIYTTAELAVLALAGLAIAVAGALGPATWAALSKTTTALHAE